MEFYSEEFSVEELVELDEILHSIVQEFGNSRIRRVYSSFKETKSSAKIRKLIEPFTEGYLKYKFSEKFLTLKAKAGTYKLKLIVDGEVSESHIEIRNDPLLEKKN